MGPEIISVAVLDALPGKEAALLATLREFYTMMHNKGYSRDTLRRDPTQPHRFLHVRYWRSAEGRAEAQADPDVHRYWQMLPELCTIPIVHESVETVFES
jgi:quinol monooxygenase YgiN